MKKEEEKMMMKKKKKEKGGGMRKRKEEEKEKGRRGEIGWTSCQTLNRCHRVLLVFPVPNIMNQMTFFFFYK